MKIQDDRPERHLYSLGLANAEGRWRSGVDGRIKAVGAVGAGQTGDLQEGLSTASTDPGKLPATAAERGRKPEPAGFKQVYSLFAL